jgi:hypothetical protein
MTEYGFGIAVSKGCFDADPEKGLALAEHVLAYNYKKSMAAMEDPPTEPPLLCGGDPYIDLESGVPMINFCWYIDTTGEYGQPYSFIKMLEVSNASTT